MNSSQSKIFGIGLSKTATTSLSKALDILGYSTRDYIGVSNYIAGDLAASIDLDIIEKNNAFTDTPLPSFYKELDERYPGAKFILTTRELQAWLKSCKKQFTPKLAEKVNAAGNQVFMDLYGCTSYDEEKFTQGYEKYVEGVLAYFANRQQDLLVIDLCDENNWSTLCSFLNKPIPEISFPMSNVTGIQRIDINDVINVARQAGMVALQIHKKNVLEEQAEENYFTKIARKFLKLDNNDALLKARKASRKVIMMGLSKIISDIPVISSPGNDIAYLNRKTWHHFWLIDPLDSTDDFLHKENRFTINIAMIQDGLPIYGIVYEPTSDILYYTKGASGSFKQQGTQAAIKLGVANVQTDKVTVLRDSNNSLQNTEDFIENSLDNEYSLILAENVGTALKLCWVADGSCDVYPVFHNTMEWHTAAAHAIVNNSGKAVKLYDGEKELSYNKEKLLNAWLIVK